MKTNVPTLSQVIDEDSAFLDELNRALMVVPEALRDHKIQHGPGIAALIVYAYDAHVSSAPEDMRSEGFRCLVEEVIEFIEKEAILLDKCPGCDGTNEKQVH